VYAKRLERGEGRSLRSSELLERACFPSVVYRCIRYSNASSILIRSTFIPLKAAQQPCPQCRSYT
jgi:hypothetical protein